MGHALCAVSSFRPHPLENPTAQIPCRGYSLIAHMPARMPAPPDNGRSMAVMVPWEGPHEAVIPRGVAVKSGDRSPSVDAQGDGALAQACAGARGIERGNGSVGGPQEAVIHTTGVRVLSSDRSGLVDVVGQRITSTGRDAERGDGTGGR